jgi:alkanesulfonate monooxygenase SsuD/methylene tetrahydromethanopterin reductase-like flavin-dependent oxidoreductase (luciferase family)
MTKFRIAINLQLDDNVARYADEARAAERDGFAMVTVADHPGTCASPAAVLGALADIVSYSGLGKTLPDGHRHEPLWSDDDVRRSVERVALAARDAGRSAPVLDILVQLNTVTDSRDVVFEKFAARSDVPIDVLRHTPFLLVGTVAQQVEQVHHNREKWGITSYTVRDRTAGAALIAALA